MAYGTLAPRSTMSGYYHFDNDSDIVDYSIDVSGNGLHLNNQPIHQVYNFSKGRMGDKGLLVESTYAYTQWIPNTMGLESNGDFTISFWMKYESGTWLWCCYDSLFSITYKALYGSGTISFIRGGGPTLNVSYTLPTTSWTYLTFVRENGFFNTIYVNGDLKGTIQNTGTQATTKNSFSFTCSYESTINACLGTFDELVVEPRAWSANEIRKYYAMCKGALAPTFSI